MILGYARVSTMDQNLDGQNDALTVTGAERVFADAITGTALSRPELNRLLRELRDRDVEVVTKYDRHARSLKDLLEIVDQIQAQIAGFRPVSGGGHRYDQSGRQVGFLRFRFDRPVRARAHR